MPHISKTTFRQLSQPLSEKKPFRLGAVPLPPLVRNVFKCSKR